MKNKQTLKMYDYEQYQENCKAIKTDNEQLLQEFYKWLKSSGLSDKTISNHIANVDFYINEFLLYNDAIEAKDGVTDVDMFLGYWFIKKAMWASQSSIRKNAASLKKFYTFMHEKNLINKQDLTDLKQTIKENMPEWLETIEDYDNL